MKNGFEILVVFVAFLATVAAECPNACSAHGKCGAYDMCTCYRNWMSNDCSERICQFGLAHVDTPKGDLDSSSGSLSSPDTTVVQNSDVYPCGTTEQYPAGKNSDDVILTNYAHEYRECSNKGMCDRSSGTCACFDGYDGAACQRASCPTTAGGVCGGHGTCQTIKEIAELDFNNAYNLWDQHSTMGCVCDGGYTGADCSEKICKSGVDPLYFDEVSTKRYSNYTYQFYTQNRDVTLSGNYSLIFTDASNQEWQTMPIAWNASCTVVQDALESLPNQVIPANSVRCYKSDLPNGHSSGQDGTEPIVDHNMYILAKFTVAFPGNPGRLPQIKINKYLDGTRPTLFTNEKISTLNWHIYPNGFIGEDIDLVPDYCEGVTVTLGYSADTVANPDQGGTHYLGGLSDQSAKALKRCLGDSNGDSSDNVEVYNWDYGSMYNPHLIKLVDATQYYPNYLADVDGGSCDNDCTLDQILKKYPSTQLCDNSAGNKAKFGADGFNIGYCSNVNSPGFYAVVYYNPLISATNPFRIFTRAANDYADDTKFFVFTTQGYLNLVSPNAVAFTKTYTWGSNSSAASYYSNVVRMSNFSTGNSPDQYADYFGNIDCETNAIGENGARDCLNKNDHIMLFGTELNGISATKNLNANPIYPNIYQVKKIFRADKTTWRGDPDFPAGPIDPSSEKLRTQIHLDYSLNSVFSWAGNNATSTDTSAQVYKFHPATNNADGGYRYVAQCSNRGICNTASGDCECFHGYTSDNCGKINALAQ